MDGLSSKNISYIREERITSWEMIAPGDHVAWQRAPSYWHHAIVISMEPETEKLTVIEYGSHADITVGKLTLVVCVQRNEKIIRDFNKIFFYRHLYHPSICHAPDTVIENATGRLGERMYNVVTNNCEHFATWCKTGKASCGQIDPIYRRLGLLPGGPILEFVFIVCYLYRGKIDMAEFGKRFFEITGEFIGGKVSISGYMLETLLGPYIRHLGLFETKYGHRLTTLIDRQLARFLARELHNFVRLVGSSDRSTSQRSGDVPYNWTDEDGNLYINILVNCLTPRLPGMLSCVGLSGCVCAQLLRLREVLTLHGS